MYSTRCHHEGGVQAIEAYLAKHAIPADRVVDKKVPSVALIDDRGYRFEGDWPATVAWLSDKDNLKPWNKK